MSDDTPAPPPLLPVRLDYETRQIAVDVRPGYGDGMVDGVAVDPHTERRRLHDQLDLCLNEVVRRDRERDAHGEHPGSK